MTESRQTSRLHVLTDAAANYSRSVVALAVLFLLTPHVIDCLGAERYGLWVLLASIIGYFELMDFGLTVATVKFVGEFEGMGDASKRNQLVSTLLATYLAIAAVVVVAASAISALLLDWLKVEVAFHHTAIVVFTILTAKTALNLPLSLFIGVLFGRQRVRVVSGVRTVFNLLYGICAWLTLSHGGGLVGFACVHAGISVTEHLVLMAICLATTPKLTLSWRSLDLPLLRRVLAFSAFALMTNLSSTALLRTDPILIKMFLPLWMVGVYGLGLKIADQLLLLTKQGLNAVTPWLARLHGLGDDAGVRQAYLTTTRWSLMAMWALAVPAACWGQETLTIWVGPRFASGGPIVAILAVAMTFRVVQEAGANVLTMTGRHQFVAWLSIATAALNIGISFLLVQHLGSYGVAAGTVIATIVAVALMVVRVCREYHIPANDFLNLSIGPVIRAGVIQLACCLTLRVMVPADSWPSLIFVGGLGVLCMPLAFWCVGLNAPQRIHILQFIHHRWQRWAGTSHIEVPVGTPPSCDRRSAN